MDNTRLKMAFIGDSLTEGIVGASYFDILDKKLPRYELHNYGKGGETVISLFHRLSRTGLDAGMDVGFLWIGVNDVFVKTSRSFPIIKYLRGQPWAKNPEQFQDFYRRTLDLLKDQITQIFTLPPLLIGEDIDNAWNKELTSLSNIIRVLSVSYANVEFVDLREAFIPQLVSKDISPYVPKSVFRVILDALCAKAPEDIEKKAAERGLRFTIDGVHLNSAGAEKVAEVLLEKLRSKFGFAFFDT